MFLELHDDFGSPGDEFFSQGQSFDVWPPISWVQFRPSTPGEILNHYYAYSLGCKAPTAWGIALSAAGGAATLGAGAGLLAGATTALKGLAAGTIKGSTALIGAGATKKMSDAVESNVRSAAKKTSDSKVNKMRRSLDSASERQRILDTYNRFYARAGYVAKMQNMTLAQLSAELPKLKKAVKEAEAKGKKVPCDTAGVRNMGVLNAAVQYCEALIRFYKETATKTPQEFNAKFTKAAASGKTSIASTITGVSLPVIILAGLILSKIAK